MVNACVNDVIVCGAKPLFFLDYIATGKMDADLAEEIVRGIAAACIENGCALIGGETSGASRDCSRRESSTYQDSRSASSKRTTS